MNGRRRFLTASVIAIQNSNFVYPSCQNCFSRLHLDLERYSCWKCGCSGEAREANYRYRLSLEVADAHGVFQVTVFGSCLEAFFGVPAKSLQRYIEDLNPEAGEAAGEASPRVLIQAVETCFIGKKFIFGVKDFEKRDGAGCSPNSRRVGRCPKALTACQMFAPNPGLVGCTVLRYLRQHQRSSGSPGGGWSPGGLFAALDQPSSELSGLHGSGDWEAVPSTHARCPSSLWPQSFGLTSSPVSGGTAADPAALDSRRTAYDELKWDNSPVSPWHHDPSIDSSQDNSLTANERHINEGDKICLRPAWHHSVFATEDPQSLSPESSYYKDPQNLLETRKEDSPGRISVQRSCGPEKSQNPLRGCSFCPVVSCGSHSGDDKRPQDDLWLWDELPSSESLNEFIARIEDGNTAVSSTETRAWKYSPSEGIGDIRGRVNQSPPQLDTTATTSQAREKLQEVSEKAGGSKESTLFCHPSNRLSFSGKEYQQEVSFSTLSAQGKDEGKRLSDHHRSLLPQLSPVGIQPSGLKGSRLSSKEGVDRHVAGRKNHHASSSLKAAGNCLQSLAHLNCECEDSVTGGEKEESSRREPKQITCEKPDKVCSGQLLPEVHKNPCKLGEISDLLQDSSIYNASADLFDAEVVIGTLNTGRAFSAGGSASTAKSTSSERQPSESETSWNTSQTGPSLLDLFAASDPKASTPDAGSAHETGCSPFGTQDFVPSSQSTPCVRPCRQAKLPRGKESVLSELPLNELPWIRARQKRPRPAFRSPLVKQLIGKFLQSRRSSDASSTARDTSMSQGSLINRSPAQEPPENDGVEWIPPSEKKWRPPLPFPNQKRFGLRSWDITEKTPFSKRQTRREIPRGAVDLARAESSPEKRQPTEVKEGVADPVQVTVASPGFCTFSSYSRSNLSSPPRSTPRAVNLSPELFGDNS